MEGYFFMDARKNPIPQAQTADEPTSRILRMQKDIEQKHHEELAARFSKETCFASAGRSGHEDLERQARETLANPVVGVFLESVQGYLLILNEHRQILAANPEFLEALGHADPDWLIGLRPGEALNCSHFTEGLDGCGTSVKCRSCGAVLALLACQEKHASVTSECSMSIRRGGATEIRDFQIRSTPLQKGNRCFTVFSILDISLAKQREVMEDVFLHDLLNSLASMEGFYQFQGQMNPQQIVQRYQSFTRYLKEEILYHRTLQEAESGTLEHANALLSASEILTELEEIMKYHPYAGRCRISFQKDVDGHHYSDKVLLFRVLLNMVLNAAEASRAGDPVTVSYENDGNSGIFSVHNPGFIPNEISAHIFERFFSTKGLPGHGFGTYSIKLLAEKYLGGRVSFATSPEAGTAFRIQLPFEGCSLSSRMNSAPDAESDRALRLPYLSGQTVSQPLHILFVDDMEPLARLGKLFLEREGFRVTAQTNPFEALALFQRMPESFGLVITDMTMPKMNGLELASRIHTLSPPMPILLCTGHRDMYPVTELKSAGIRAVVSKPFISTELDRVVRQIRYLIGT
jgi:CheY-like chemotaxis protein